MDYFDVIEGRKSVRSFKRKEVSEEDVERLLSASMLAPSAGNLKAYKIIVVRDKSNREKLAAAAMGQDFIIEAPVCMVVCASGSGSRYGERGRQLYSLQDATIVAAYIQLTAVAMGLASVWVGAFDEGEVARIVGAPHGVRPIALIPVGYAGETPPRAPRKGYCGVVSRERL